MILLKNVLYARIATEVLTHSIALQKKGGSENEGQMIDD